MTKQQQFITEVQTAIIIRKILENPGAGHKAMWPALINMDDAFYASERIPEDMTAHMAACQWLEAIFEDNKEEGYKKPQWMMRG